MSASKRQQCEEEEEEKGTILTPPSDFPTLPPPVPMGYAPPNNLSMGGLLAPLALYDGRPEHLSKLMLYDAKKALLEQDIQLCWLKQEQCATWYLPLIHAWSKCTPRDLSPVIFPGKVASLEFKLRKGEYDEVWVERHFIELWKHDDTRRTLQFSGIYPPGADYDKEITLNLWTPFHAETLAKVDGVSDDEVKTWALDLSPPISIEAPFDTTKYLPVEVESNVAYAKRVVGIWKVLVWVMSNGDPEGYVFILRWVANIFQYPGKMSSLLAIRGKGGMGKSCFSKIISAMVGFLKSFETDDPKLTVFTGFNTAATNFFNVFNEITNEDFSNHKIKRFVTEEISQIRALFCEVKVMEVFRRVLVITNYELTAMDRRFSVSECLNILFGKERFFDSAHQILKDKRALRVLYDFNMSVDLSGFRSDSTHTFKYDLSNKTASLTSQPLFIYLQSVIAKFPWVDTPLYVCKPKCKGGAACKTKRPLCGQPRNLLRFEPGDFLTKAGEFVAELKAKQENGAFPPVAANPVKLARDVIPMVNSFATVLVPVSLPLAFSVVIESTKTKKALHFLDVDVIRKCLGSTKPVTVEEEEEEVGEEEEDEEEEEEVNQQ